MYSRGHHIRCSSLNPSNLSYAQGYSRIHHVFKWNYTFPLYHQYDMTLAQQFLYWGSRYSQTLQKECIFFTWLIATPLHKNLCRGGNEINNFWRPFLGHYDYILSCLIYSQEDILVKEIHHFYTFTPKTISSWSGGHEIYNFLSPHHIDVTYKIW